MKRFYILFLAQLIVAGAFAQDNLRVKQLFHWHPDTIPGSAIFDNAYNEIWGVTQDGREYAIIGSTLGTHIFDVTDVTNSTEVALIPGKDNGPVIIHRDYHDYNGYLYAVADEGESSLQIIDLSHLPDSAPVVYDSDSLLITTHNIFIDSAHERLYAAVHRDSSFTRTPVKVFSLENPIDPRPIGIYRPPFGQQTHDLYVLDNIGYCHNAQQGLTIVDFTDLENIIELGRLSDYPDKGYNHSGWLMEGGKYYAFADENHGEKIKILDVEDPTNISVVTLLYSDVHPDSSMAHNLIFKDSFLYVSYYHDGMYVFNMENPERPFVAGYYDTYAPNDHESYRGNWGVYPFLPSGNILASDMQYGLYIFDVTEALAAEPPPSTSVIDVKKLNIQLYPNPTSDWVMVSLPQNASAKAQVTITDMQGRIVRTLNDIENVGFLRLNVSDLSAGNYHISVSDKEFTGVATMIKR